MKGIIDQIHLLKNLAEKLRKYEYKEVKVVKAADSPVLGNDISMEEVENLEEVIEQIEDSIMNKVVGV